jgi:hypothetical protein
MTGHLGYEKHDTTGAVEIDVPRGRAATFEPQIVKKRYRRLSGVDEVVLSLYAKGRPQLRRQVGPAIHPILLTRRWRWVIGALRASP